MYIDYPKALFIILIAIFLCSIVQAAQFKILLFTETEGYHHQSIAEGVQALRKLSKKHNFAMHWTEISSIFTDSSLHDYDAVVFLNTDGNVLSSEEQKGLKKYYQNGNGFVGIHGAAATELEWAWFGKMIGRKFIIHPEIQTAELNVTDQDFPATYHLPEKMIWTDEWYEFGSELSDNLNYLITVDETSYNAKAKWEDTKGDGMGDFHPVAWYQKFDGGRSFYTALGHIGEAFKDPDFLKHIYGGIYWAALGIEK
ncbi:MAG: ThuA domain-containing protein [Candidatus Marinimicrobia bacterium]|nr:ThuA domain-containing protein [Candidatus Neomarinimicrobiota bacterium]